MSPCERRPSGNARWDQAVAERQEMLDALERRDGPALRGILECHLKNKRDVVVAAIEARMRANDNAGAAPASIPYD
jgi:DNA-binding GntR family transcriptional regulator